MPAAAQVPPGQRFGRLVVVREGPPLIRGGQRRRTMICRCDCRSPDKAVRLELLVTGRTKSCGCLRAELARTKVTPKPRKLSARARLEARISQLTDENHRLIAEIESLQAEVDMYRSLSR